MIALRAHVIALVLGASGAALGAMALGAGCGDFSAAADAPDAGDGAAAATPDADNADGGPQSDAGAPCSDRATVLFGPSSLGLEARTPDFIAKQTRDAHFFVAQTTGSARCAWLYIATAPTHGAVHFGVYADKGGAPDALIGRAKFDSPVAGWNSAPLAGKLPIVSGTPMWIGVGPDQASVEVSSVQDAGCQPHAFTGELDAGVELADPFSGGNRYPSCDLAAYLGP